MKPTKYANACPIWSFHYYDPWRTYMDPTTNDRPNDASAVATATTVITAVASPPPINRAGLAALLGTGLAGMVIDFPAAPDLRGLILQKTQEKRGAGVWVPDGVTDMARWLQENVALPAAAPAAPAAPYPPAPSLPSSNRHWTFSGSYKEREHGTCTYHRTLYYAGTVRLSEEALARLAADSESVEDFKERVSEAVNDDAGDEFGVTDERGNEYEDYDLAEGDGKENFEIEDLDSGIDEYLAMHGDVMRRLNGEPEEEEETEQDDDDEEEEDDDA